MQRLVAISCCFYWLLHCFAFATDIHPVQQAFDLRQVDRAKSEALLTTIEPLELNDKQRIRYEYLDAYHKAFSGDIESSLVRLVSLQSQTKEPDLWLAIGRTLLSLYSGVRQWEQGFELIYDIELYFFHNAERTTLEDELNASAGIATFYLAVEEYHLVRQKLEPVLATSEDLGLVCSSYSIYVRALTKLAERTDLDSVFESAIKSCENTGLEVYLHNILSTKLQKHSALLSDEDKLTQGLALLTKMQAQSFPPQIHSLQSFIAELYCKQAAYGKCYQHAKSVINNGSDSSYLPPRIESHRLAAKASAELGNFAQAYQYQTEYSRLEREYFSENSAKKLAVQKAYFESRSKQSRIDLLRKQNSVLKVEAELASQRVQNVAMGMVLAGIVVLLSLLWSWRSLKTQNKLKVIAQTDPLTKVASRGYFSSVAQKKLDKGRPKDKPISLLLFDLDFFKRINDNFGHQIGDWALVSAVRAVEKCIPKSALLGRIAGEEFGILVEGKTGEEALELAECCRQAIQSIRTQPTMVRFSITASFGVADSLQASFDFDTLLSASDLALYRAKLRGRNVVYRYTDGLSID